MKRRLAALLAVGVIGFIDGIAVVAEAPWSIRTQALTNGEVRLRITRSNLVNLRLESSTDLAGWSGLTTLVGGNSSLEYIDSAAPWMPWRFYRGTEVSATNAIAGDHLATADGEVTFHPINHATFVMQWQGKAIYWDPVGAATRFRGLPAADLILLTHGHSDHFEAATINAVKGSNVVILAPSAVYQAMPAALKALTTILTNGASTNWLGLNVEAVPAYNLTASYHPKGVGNGYVMTVGGKRIYVSGDTEDVPELRALSDIDVAFVCMNLPFTMTVDRAADAVRQFRPKVIYPYHFSDSNVSRFKQRVGIDLGIEVRQRTWY